VQEWSGFRQVTENYNGVCGIGEDVGNAGSSECAASALLASEWLVAFVRENILDPFYTWGALPGLLSFQEAGLL
jgi:hypothetical protein